MRKLGWISSGDGLSEWLQSPLHSFKAKPQLHVRTARQSGDKKTKEQETKSQRL